MRPRSGVDADGDKTATADMRDAALDRRRACCCWCEAAAAMLLMAMAAVPGLEARREDEGGAADEDGCGIGGAG